MSEPQSTRLPENSQMAFHEGTEARLAAFVEATATQGDAQSVLDAVDQFCWKEHWMMHLGDVKGPIVEKVFVDHKPKIVLELGTYCGYSAVRLARHVSEKYYTIDAFPRPEASTLINKAGFGDKVVQLSGAAQDVIPKLAHLQGKVDLVFIDHDKQVYLSDLILIEEAGLLHPGSVVVADNVLVFHLNAYREHVKNSPKYSSTVTHESRLEYDDSNNPEFVDGLEVSIWKGN